jgi:hypothetical protein
MSMTAKYQVDESAMADWLAPQSEPMLAAVAESNRVTTQALEELVPLTTQAVQIGQNVVHTISAPMGVKVWRDGAGVLHGGYNTEERSRVLAQSQADMAAVLMQAAEIVQTAAARLAELTATIMAEQAALNRAVEPYCCSFRNAAELMTEMHKVVPAWPPVAPGAIAADDADLHALAKPEGVEKYVAARRKAPKGRRKPVPTDE